MKFSIKVQYGLQALLELSLSYGGGSRQIKDIAKNQAIPARFLEQLLLVLKKNGLVTSSRGKNGGYLLAKNPDQINFLDVVETFEGQIELAGKKLKKTSVLYEAFNKSEESLKKSLSEITLEDLVLRKRQKDRAITYNI